jgi:hypothetical protein
LNIVSLVADEVRTLAALQAHRRELVDPAIARLQRAGARPQQRTMNDEMTEEPPWDLVGGLDLAMPNFWGVWRQLPLIKRSRNNKNMRL